MSKDLPPESHFRSFLEAIGADISGKHANLDQAPDRFTELLRSFVEDKAPPKPTLMAAEGDGVIAVGEIEFISLCEHHLVPFFGTMSLAYQPNQAIVGLGALDRIVGHFARRPQIQERLTEQVAEFLESLLQPAGVGVLCRARHMCREMTGGSPAATVTTLVRRGSLSEAILSELFSPSVND